MTPRAPRRQAKGQGRRGQAPSPLAPPPGGYRLAVLVGIPGSGKSTFASFLSSMGWRVVNQDKLGSRANCEVRARELLLQGQRVIIDRCSFDQSQRSTWTELAASVSIGPDLRVAVWLNIPTDICHGRVQGRSGHPTLGPGPAAADVVSRMAISLRPPSRSEGFRDVLHCRGDRDLSEAVAVLSAPGGFSPPLFSVSRPPPRVAHAFHGGTTSGPRRGGHVFYGRPSPVSPRAPHAFHDGTTPVPSRVPNAFHGGIIPVNEWNGNLPTAQPPPAMTMVPWHSGQLGGGGDQLMHPPSADNFPSLPGRYSSSSGGYASGADTSGGPSEEPTPLQSPGERQGYDMNRTGADFTVSCDEPFQAKTDSLTTTGPVADFGSAQESQSQVLEAPQDVGSSASNSAQLETTEKGKFGAALLQGPITLPLENTDFLTSPLDSALARDIEHAGEASGCRDTDSSVDPQSTPQRYHAISVGSVSEGVLSAESHPAKPARATAETTDSAMAGRDSGFSEGEAFLVLEDMFGGLLSSDVLGEVYMDSKQNLEESVRRAFKLCRETWDRDEELSNSGSVVSDAVTADASLTATSSADCNSIGDGFDIWDEGDELADVSEWTHGQLDALTELCLAFEERPREEVVAALVSANYNPGEAAQVLLETSEEIPMGGNMALHSGQGGRKRRRAARRDQKRAVQSVGTASSLLGVTCGDRSRLGKAKNDGGGVEREDVVSEEEGDERLSSEIYRARAAAAAEDMKNWFHKAAEAFTKGGRNGGAAATHPSEEGHRCKKKMEALNVRAAREAFREKNPLIKVGRTTDDRSVLKVLALPEPSECSTRGKLAVDLHLLRKTEAVSALEAVLDALHRRRSGEELRSRPSPLPRSQATGSDSSDTNQSSAPVHGFGAVMADAGDISTLANSRKGKEPFSYLEVVVGRGSHSERGVARLRPVVTKYLTSRGFKAEAVGGDIGAGMVLVRLL